MVQFAIGLYLRDIGKTRNSQRVGLLILPISQSIIATQKNSRIRESFLFLDKTPIETPLKKLEWFLIPTSQF